jgi:hypothetical protein
MAGGSRTLKLSILGDVDGLNKSLTSATKDVDTFSDKIGKTSKVIGAAFVAAAAAAGTFALKLGVDGVKAALEDEKAQRILALTLENTTGATKRQVAAIETYITKTALATGVTDDQLRPAFSRLVRSTKDTEDAQKLLSLALDISAATGKPLEAIANSLSKGYDGNTNALGKLGLGIDQSILKTKDFNKVYDNLRTSFDGFSKQESVTFQGRIDRVKVAFDEAKETIGFAFLPILEKLLGFINVTALPILDTFSKGFDFLKADTFSKSLTNIGTVLKNTVLPIFEGAKDIFNNVKDAIIGSKDEFESFFEVVGYFAPKIGKVIGAGLSIVGEIAGLVITIFGKVLSAIQPLINFAIDGINLVIRGLNLIKPGADIASIGKIGAMPSVAGFSGTTPGGQTFNTGTTTTSAGSSIPSVGTFTGGATGGLTGVNAAASGGVAAASNAAALAAAGYVRLTPVDTEAYGVRNAGVAAAAAAAAVPATTINVTVNGALNAEGTARTIVDTLNNSYYRGTGGANNLVTT